MDARERREAVAGAFRQRFGSDPEVWVRAPGRVDLMGSHTDYNLGYVMTMTLDRDTWIAARPRNDGRGAIDSLNLEGGGEFDLARIEHDPVSPWTDYVRGVARVLQSAGHLLTGFDGLIHSTVPFGSGLSSSAALEMATVAVFEQVSGLVLDRVEAALLGQRAENEFVGVNCGILDQYSSALGQAGCALFLDCRDLSSRSVPIDSGISVVICDTRATRNLAGSEYAERRAQCEEGARLLSAFDSEVGSLRDVSLDLLAVHESALPPVVAKRCRFIIEENERVLRLAEALPSGDRAALGELFAESYRGARELYEISAPAMEAMMTAMTSGPGVIGARQAGAGFGGCMVALVERDAVGAFAAHVLEAYERSTGIQPSVYPVEAAAGMGPVRE